MSKAAAQPESSNTPPDHDGSMDLLAFPASPAQEAFFYLEKLRPSHPAFNVPVRFELEGILDPKRLKSAFDSLAVRHEGLRTRFVEEEGNLLQVIAPVTEFPMPLIDLSHLTGEDQKAEVDRLGSDEARTPFDLSKDPLFRASLIRRAPDHHILQITIHHSVADGWSIGIMTDELAEFYNASAENRSPRLEPLAIQYADFTIWQREFLESPELLPHLEYWKNRMQGYNELELPADRPRPPVKSWDGDIVSLVLRPSISEEVAKISRDKGATMFHVFLAAFKAVASRYTGLDDIAVGSPVAGRTRAELEPIIGTFINSVILRTDLSGDPSFGDLVVRVRETVTEAIAHQDLPFEQLVKALQPRRDSGRNPLFQINFTHQRDFVKPVSFGAARLTAIPSRSPGAIFDLHFFMVERADGWRASCDFSRDLFDRETALRLLDHFETFLDAAAGSPDIPLSKLPLLKPSEVVEISRWSGRTIPYPSDRSLGELFLDQATRHPARIALTLDKRDISYQLLASSALELRTHLLDAGVRPGDRVAVCAPSVPEMIAAQIAILLIGAACVPLDPDYPRARLRFMIEDSAAAVLLTTPALAQLLPACKQTILLAPVSDSVATHPIPDLHPQADAVSHIFYTSGSTGNPKGVQVRHRGVSRIALGGGFMDFGPDDSFLQSAPISFDAAILEIWMPLLHGGRIVLTGQSGPSLPAIARAIREQGVTCLWLTAGLFQTMVDEHLADLKGLRYLLAGGDVLSPSHVRTAFEALPGTTLINGYGPTENTTFTCCHTVTRADLDGRSIPIGRSIGNTTVYILDAMMRPLPVGIPGELFTGGDGLATGYLNHDELTASKFLTHPDFGRLYRTGDLCRWTTEGTIEFIGRSDDQVKVRGFRIELGEIESVLSSHPNVRQARAAVRGNSAETKRIFAWVVPREGQSVTPVEIAEYLADRLPAFMRPDGIAVIDSFPLNSNGKIDLSPLADPGPRITSLPHSSHEPPTGNTEQRLASIWMSLLDLPQIGRHDDFFALGGHSLMALRMFSRINRDFAKALPLATLLQFPTISKLAGLLEPEDSHPSATTVQHPLPLPLPNAGSRAMGNVVTLAAGSTQRPLFCIHGGDGGVIFYRGLSALMPAELPVHAIESLELGNSGMVAQSSIEDTAAAYVRVVLAIQSEGPFRLAGYSFGGVVAHEMACQLVEQGHQVHFLGLFDTQSPAAPTRNYSPAERLRVFWQQTADLPVRERLARLGTRIREGIQTHRRVQSELKIARSATAAEAYSDLRRIQVREENWRAMQAYQPRPFKGRITLFKTSFVNDKVEYPADYGWSEAAAAGLDIISVSGQHLSLFAPEHVESLAWELTRSLNRSSAQASS